MRQVLGVLAGVIAAFAAVMATQYLVGLVYPLPNVNMYDKPVMDALFRSLPAAHFALILLTYVVGGFVGGYVGRAVARRDWAGWVAPALVTAAAALNVVTYPHPVWAQIGGIAAPLLGGWLAARLAPRRTEDDAEPEAADADA